jgi:hypothetical protein
MNLDRSISCLDSSTMVFIALFLHKVTCWSLNIASSLQFTNCVAYQLHKTALGRRNRSRHTENRGEGPRFLISRSPAVRILETTGASPDARPSRVTQLTAFTSNIRESIFNTKVLLQRIPKGVTSDTSTWKNEEDVNCLSSWRTDLTFKDKCLARMRRTILKCNKKTSADPHFSSSRVLTTS